MKTVVVNSENIDSIINELKHKRKTLKGKKLLEFNSYLMPVEIIVEYAKRIGRTSKEIKNFMNKFNCKKMYGKLFILLNY